ncbi:hypothetical protein D3C81_2043820 [compost metagenome]
MAGQREVVTTLAQVLAQGVLDDADQFGQRAFPAFDHAWPVHVGEHLGGIEAFRLFVEQAHAWGLPWRLAS